MNLPWSPRFVCSDIDFAFSMPMRPPSPRKGGVGGTETAAAGIPASYSVRRDYLLSVPLRFTEEEWPEVEALIDLMQTHPGATAFYADLNQLTPSNLCYLESPAMGTEWGPTRGEFFGSYDLTIVLRSTGEPWDVPYYSDVLDES